MRLIAFVLITWLNKILKLLDSELTVSVSLFLDSIKHINIIRAKTFSETLYEQDHDIGG